VIEVLDGPNYNDNYLSLFILGLVQRSPWT